MFARRRIERLKGRHSRVDGVPFQLPVRAKDSPALMAVFSCDPEAAATLLPGNELHPYRLWKRALLIVTVIDYRDTNIGQYVEYSIGIACTHGSSPAPRLLPGALMRTFGTGQYVVDLPVSSEISVKGGKGIWGMPKHRANLDFKIKSNKVSSQYDLDGQLCAYVEIEEPGDAKLPMKLSAANYCAFRGMLFKSVIHLDSKAWLGLGSRAMARFVIGDHPRVQCLKTLNHSKKPLATAFIPAVNGALDDTVLSWFLSFETPPDDNPEGMESVVDLTLSEKWLEPPSATVADDD
jgi:hypothetical protein